MNTWISNDKTVIWEIDRFHYMWEVYWLNTLHRGEIEYYSKGLMFHIS